MTVFSAATNGGRSVLITVSGKFDLHSHRDFRDSYCNENPAAAYTLDLTKTESIDSSALGIMLLLREFAGGDDADINIRGCSEKIKKIFKYTNFEKLFSYS